VVDSVNVPVIAAGGIGDARGVVAAFALGAKGVQIGTRFVASRECIAHPRYKEIILKAKDRSTTVTGASTGHPVRAIANKLTREFQLLEKRGATPQELDRLGTGKLKIAARDGDVENGSVMVGQIAGLIHNIKPVAAIIDDIIQDIAKVVANINTMTQYNQKG